MDIWCSYWLQVAGMRPEQNQQPMTSNIQINLVLACPGWNLKHRLGDSLAQRKSLNLRKFENLPNTDDDFQNRTGTSFLFECAGRIGASELILCNL
ncbi:MAG: hypothetical protein GY705_01080 [Bacteroidetes bacterium]|nr:hypothetical protein [Bacteroidota bacterium]